MNTLVNTIIFYYKTNIRPHKMLHVSTMEDHHQARRNKYNGNKIYSVK